MRRRAAMIAGQRPSMSLRGLLDDPDVTVVEAAAWACGEQEVVDDDVLQKLIDLGVAVERRVGARGMHRRARRDRRPAGLADDPPRLHRQAGRATPRRCWRSPRSTATRSTLRCRRRSWIAIGRSARPLKMCCAPATTEDPLSPNFRTNSTGLRGCSPRSRREHSYATTPVDRGPRHIARPSRHCVRHRQQRLRPGGLARFDDRDDARHDIAGRHAGRAAEVRGVHARERHRHGRPHVRRRRQPDRRWASATARASTRGPTSSRTAQTACGDLLQGVQFGGRGRGGIDREAIQNSLNDFTACLRDEGLDVDDITFGPPGGRANGTTGGNGGDRRLGARPAQTVGGGFGGPPPGGSAPANGKRWSRRPRRSGFDPTARMIERLGLDDTDPKVIAALAKCEPIMTAAFQPQTSTTTATTP